MVRSGRFSSDALILTVAVGAPAASALRIESAAAADRKTSQPLFTESRGMLLNPIALLFFACWLYAGNF